jgi:hypothetical protein
MHAGLQGTRQCRVPTKFNTIALLGRSHDNDLALRINQCQQRHDLAPTFADNSPTHDKKNAPSDGWGRVFIICRCLSMISVNPPLQNLTISRSLGEVRITRSHSNGAKLRQQWILPDPDTR